MFKLKTFWIKKIPHKRNLKSDSKYNMKENDSRFKQPEQENKQEAGELAPRDPDLGELFKMKM